jgi:hypothetical protein
LATGATLGDAGRGGSVGSRVNEFFNTKNFVPAPYVPDGGLIEGKYPVSGGGTIFGGLGRNILRGPDQQDIDIAAIKTTSLIGRVKLIFRWEIFNALNRPNFANPSNDVSTPSTFGVISGKARADGLHRKHPQNRFRPFVRQVEDLYGGAGTDPANLLNSLRRARIANSQL